MLRPVISLHGIWTRGTWQKDLAPLLARHGFVPYALDYGNFTPIELMFPFRHGAKLEWLRKEVERVVADANCRRPSIVAHSFGALLVTRLLEKFEHVKFDKVILCGSIARAGFDWCRCFSLGQVNLIRNEHGALDVWPRVARWLVRGAGDAGTRGFSLSPHERFVQHRFDRYGHSDYFSAGHFEKHWLPHLDATILSGQDQKRVRELLQVMIATAAGHLGIGRNKLRANFFVCRTRDGSTFPEGCTRTCHRRRPRFVLERGTGCTGKAYELLRQIVAIREGGDWGDHEVPAGTASLLDPDLRWIVSTPVRDPDTHGGILGVLNLDGLDIVATSDIQKSLGDLKVFADKLGTLLKGMA